MQRLHSRPRKEAEGKETETATLLKGGGGGGRGRGNRVVAVVKAAICCMVHFRHIIILILCISAMLRYRIPVGITLFFLHTYHIERNIHCWRYLLINNAHASSEVVCWDLEVTSGALK